MIFPKNLSIAPMPTLINLQQWWQFKVVFDKCVDFGKGGFCSGRVATNEATHSCKRT